VNQTRRRKLPTMAFAVRCRAEMRRTGSVALLTPEPPRSRFVDAINTNDQRHVAVVIKVGPRRPLSFSSNVSVLGSRRGPLKDDNRIELSLRHKQQRLYGLRSAGIV
jgi:hypothetical protein